MNKEVFISYKSDEFDDANWVRSILEQNGISCWMAPSCIPGGSNYAEEIPKAIKGCKVFVLILSEKSQKSKWVPKEIDQAINEGKIIMPFMIENCSLKDDFNFYLSNIQRYYAYENKVAAIRNMIVEICAVLGRPAPTATEDEKPAEEKTSDNDIATEDEKPAEEKISDNDTATEDEKPAEEKISDNDTATENHPIPETKKDKKVPKKEKTKNKANKKKIIIPTIIALAVIIVIVLGVFIVPLVAETHKVSIAGQEIYADTTYLDMENVTFSQEDIDTISKMNICSVDLDSCTLPDEMIPALCNENIYTLRLSNCSLDDNDVSLINFEQLTSLNTLDLSYNEGITTLEPLSKISSYLYTLNISGTSVTDLTPINQLEYLNALKIADLKLEDISAIKNMTSLTELDISGNELKDLDAITALIYLEIFSAANNPLESFEGLYNCTVLKELDMSSTGISDISFIKKSANTLKNLYLNDNSITDISPIESTVYLEKLYLDNNHINSLLSLRSLTTLKELSLAGNDILSITYLDSNSNLEYLNVSGNNLTGEADLSFITSQRDYYYPLTLDVSNNPNLTGIRFSDINIESLNIRGTKISNLSSLTNTIISKMTADYNAETDYSVISNTINYNLSLYNCPLDKRVELEEIFAYNNIIFADEEESSTIA